MGPVTTTTPGVPGGSFILVDKNGTQVPIPSGTLTGLTIGGVGINVQTGTAAFPSTVTIFGGQHINFNASTTGTWTSGGTAVTIPTAIAAMLTPGTLMTGTSTTNVPANTYIVSIAGGVVTVNNALGSSGTDTVSFYGPSTIAVGQNCSVFISGYDISSGGKAGLMAAVVGTTTNADWVDLLGQGIGVYPPNILPQTQWNTHTPSMPSCHPDRRPGLGSPDHGHVAPEHHRSRRRWRSVGLHRQWVPRHLGVGRRGWWKQRAEPHRLGTDPAVDRYLLGAGHGRTGGHVHHPAARHAERSSR